MRSSTLRARRHALWATAAVFVAAAGLVVAQPTHPVSGRRIAGVMGHEGAPWLERPEREAQEAPRKAVAALNIRAGETIADIGAGSGYYTVLLAEAVGPRGRVYATDIQPEMLALIQKKIEARALRNVQPVLGTETSTGLPDGSLDLALMVDVYHELGSRRSFCGRWRARCDPTAGWC